MATTNQLAQEIEKVFQFGEVLQSEIGLEQATSVSNAMKHLNGMDFVNEVIQLAVPYPHNIPIELLAMTSPELKWAFLKGLTDDDSITE